MVLRSPLTAMAMGTITGTAALTARLRRVIATTALRKAITITGINHRTPMPPNWRGPIPNVTEVQADGRAKRE